MKSRAEIATRVALIVIPLFVAACAGSGAKPASNAILSDDPTWGKAIVTNAADPGHLAQFHEKFKEVLGDSDLEAHQIGCTEGCDKFSTSPPPNRLVYIFPREHKDILLMFGRAWDATVASTGDKGLTLQFDGDVPEPDCGAPRPQPCQSMPYCSDGCGRKSPPSCSIC